ncbi:MAG: hypothetical protein ACFFED_17000 [Candidatus Thorarchaeota archaeon]
MESIEESGVRNYVREKRLQALKTLMTINGRYNEVIKELKDRREVIAKQRYDGEITLQQYWDSRMELEDRIQAMTEKRDEVVKRIITLLPKTKADTRYIKDKEEPQVKETISEEDGLHEPKAKKTTLEKEIVKEEEPEEEDDSETEEAKTLDTIDAEIESEKAQEIVVVKEKSDTQLDSEESRAEEANSGDAENKGAATEESENGESEEGETETLEINDDAKETRI